MRSERLPFAHCRNPLRLIEYGGHARLRVYLRQTGAACHDFDDICSVSRIQIETLARGKHASDFTSHAVPAALLLLRIVRP
jgi:hypothetical protein